MTTFTVYGQPFGKERPKFARMGAFVKTYTPEKTTSYENYIKVIYKNTTDKIHEKPLKMTVRAFYCVPDSWSNKKRLAALSGNLLPTVKPDIDNIVKVICDGLNKIAYLDDKQIVSLSCEKKYDKVPRVEINIEEIGGD